MSSKRRIRRNACDGKVRFADITTAMSAAWSARKEGLTIRLMRAYQCGFCHHWHIGGGR